MDGFEAARERLLGIFFDEVIEHVDALEKGALSLESGAANRDEIGRMFRAAHSIKGSGSALGLGELAHFVHGLEDLLDQLREGKIDGSRRVGRVVLDAVDAIGHFVNVARKGGTLPDVTSIERELKALRESTNATTSSTATTTANAGADRVSGDEGGMDRGMAAFAATAVTAATSPAPPALRARVTFRPGQDAFVRGLDPLLLLRDLARICDRFECSCDQTQLLAANGFDPEVSYLTFVIDIQTTHPRADIEEIFDFVGGEEPLRIEERGDERVEQRVDERADSRDDKVSGAASTQIASALPVAGARGSAPPPAKPAVAVAAAAVPALSPAPSAVGSSVRVDIGKIDRLMDVVGEIVIAQAMLKDLVGSMASNNLPSLQSAIQDLERNTRELQERVMSIRMLPVSILFQKFPRIVRELGDRLAKEVRLVTVGGDTELDKTLIDLLSDPLTHLVRNAVDHGLETTEERRLAGKDPVGVVTIRARHDAGSVVITVDDDGRGIDGSRVIAKARSVGLIRADEEVNEAKMLSLLFEPGFSTAAQVTDVSGRGVGMDVVKRNVELLNGVLTVENHPGKGASFVVRLPLTLAIVEGLLINVGDQVFVLPLLSVLKSFSMKREQFRLLHDGSEIVDFAPRPLPLVRLGRIFGVQGAKDPTDGGLTIVIQDGKQHFCLLVDGIRGRVQVVMKNLEANFRRMEGVLGATILGNGHVALVLDVAGLARLGRVGSDAGQRLPDKLPPRATVERLEVAR